MEMAPAHHLHTRVYLGLTSFVASPRWRYGSVYCLLSTIPWLSRPTPSIELKVIPSGSIYLADATAAETGLGLGSGLP